MTVRKFVTKLLIEELQDDTWEYDGDFADDLEMDSLERITLVSYVEEEYGIQINEGDLEAINTPEKLIRFVEDRE